VQTGPTGLSAPCAASAAGLKAQRSKYSRRGVTSVIIGPRTFAQYEQNMAGFDLQLEPVVIKRLSDASQWAR
jgi:hypothetical protein